MAEALECGFRVGARLQPSLFLLNLVLDSCSIELRAENAVTVFHGGDQFSVFDRPQATAYLAGRSARPGAHIVNGYFPGDSGGLPVSIRLGDNVQSLVLSLDMAGVTSEQDLDAFFQLASQVAKTIGSEQGLVGGEMLDHEDIESALPGALVDLKNFKVSTQARYFYNLIKT